MLSVFKIARNDGRIISKIDTLDDRDKLSSLPASGNLYPKYVAWIYRFCHMILPSHRSLEFDLF